MFVDGGRIPGGAVGVRNAALMINFVPKQKRSISQQKLEQSISKELESVPDIRYWFIDENGQRNVTFIVTGTDSRNGVQCRRRTRNADAASPLRVERVIRRDAEPPRVAHLSAARSCGACLACPPRASSETIRVATIGDVGPALAKFTSGDRVIPVRVLLDEKARARSSERSSRSACRRAGPGVPLASIADISFDASPVSISRYDRQRQARVEADLVEGLRSATPRRASATSAS